MRLHSQLLIVPGLTTTGIDLKRRRQLSFPQSLDGYEMPRANRHFQHSTIDLSPSRTTLSGLQKVSTWTFVEPRSASHNTSRTQRWPRVREACLDDSTETVIYSFRRFVSKVVTKRQRREIFKPGASAKRSGARRPWNRWRITSALKGRDT